LSETFEVSPEVFEVSSCIGSAVGLFPRTGLPMMVRAVADEEEIRRRFGF
jgi:hypothetical protein